MHGQPSPAVWSEDTGSFYFGSTTAATPEGPVANPAEISRETTGLDPAPDGSGYRIGRYRLIKMLGTGSFGTVYLARDSELDRHVAIKMPKLDRIATEADVQTYVAEARKLAGLDHSHIVPLYDIGRAGDGRCYVVSKFIDGGDLASWRESRSPKPRDIALSIMQIASGLDHSHKRGLIHRDIKPANILIDSVGQPYLTDFGLALYSGSSRSISQLAGSPAYMSPEQTMGEIRSLDGRSDVFSLGVVFYELLAGRKPFEGRDLSQLCSAIRDHQPPSPDAVRPEVPESLAKICMRCLEKNPKDRFNTAGLVAQSLSTWLSWDARAERDRSLSQDPWPPHAVAWFAGALLLAVVSWAWWALNEYIANGVKPAVPPISDAPWLMTAATITISIGVCLLLGARSASRERRPTNLIAWVLIALLLALTWTLWYAVGEFAEWAVGPGRIASLRGNP